MEEKEKKNINEEIKSLKEKLSLEQEENNQNEINNKEDILYRLIYLNKKINNEKEEKYYIELCLNNDIILSEEMWIDYINIKKKEKNISSDDIINLYLQSLNNFYYPSIIFNFFYFLLNKCVLSKDYTNYFFKYLSIGIFSPEYSLKIFDLFYQFFLKLFNDTDNFKDYIKKKLKKKCNLSEYEIDQILTEYKTYKTNKIFFIFEYKKNENEEESEEEDDSEEIKDNIILKITEFNEQFNLLFNESLETNHLIISQLEENFSLIYKVNKKYLIYYYNKILSKYIDNSNLWKNYISLIDNIPNANINKLNILEMAFKCCKKEGVFTIDYLHQLELSTDDNSYLEKKIIELIKDPKNKNKIEDIYVYYLQYKIRHFNNNEREIKSIRNIFKECLSKVENYEINLFTGKIYHMWAEFEVYKTKNKEMFFNIMKKIFLTLDKSINCLRAFIYFAKSFPNNEIQIREVYKLAYNNLIGEERNAIEKNWLEWECLFGDINTINDLKKMIKDNDYYLNMNNNNENINNGNDKEKNTVYIKGIYKEIKENELKDFIKKKCPLIEYKDLRLVLDDNGKNKGFAFVDFNSDKEAKLFVDEMNKKNNDIKLENSEINCALSLPPKMGKNDKRTLFINNLPFDVGKEEIKDAFGKYGHILDIRIIYNPVTGKPRGYGYVEFKDESSIDKIINSDKNFIIKKRKILVSKSISVEKLRNAVKYVVHISNLNFKVKEQDIKNLLKKEIFEDKEEILNDEIRKILLCKDDEGKFKGYGFIEFNSKESFDKCIQLDGKIFKGRNLVIKESTRNITEKSENNKKKKIIEDKEQKFTNKKRKKEKKKEKNDEENDKDTSKNEKNKKKKMNNSDFQKLFS